LSDAEQIARLRVACATGRLPLDLGHWALARALETLAAAERRAQRDDLLRRAAGLFEGTTYARASAILDLIALFDAAPGLLICGCFPPQSAEGLVQAALRLHAKLPRTRRRLLSILAAN